MRSASCILSALAVVGCSKPAVESNQRFSGEPATIARELTPAERRAAIDAMASAQSDGFESSPLVPAGEHGRWREVRSVVIAAVKVCEVAVVTERIVPGGLSFDLLAINDVPGSIRVTGSEAEGVTGVQVEMGTFGEHRELADRIVREFERELRRYSRLPRPK